MSNLRDKITAKVKVKTSKVKDKVAANVAKKCGKACAVLALLAAFAGCHMGEQPTAQRAQTSTITDNRIDIRVLAPTNVVYDKEGNPVAAVRIEIGNQAQANDTSGTETMTASPSNTPTVSTPVRVDARYNDAMAAASNASKDVIGLLDEASKEAVLKLMSSKETGTVKVTKTDGTSATVKCEGGQCEFCKECEL